MEDSTHSECSLDRFELADGERENEQVRLVAEATMAEVFQVAGLPTASVKLEALRSRKPRFLDHLCVVYSFPSPYAPTVCYR